MVCIIRVGVRLRTLHPCWGMPDSTHETVQHRTSIRRSRTVQVRATAGDENTAAQCIWSITQYHLRAAQWYGLPQKML